jgi:aspartyl-tRNA(Asn)/glutamyl-tRNA(Gln) amidotransferase subunit A
MALCFTLDKLGPMARSAEDCAAILRVIAGHDEGDPSSAQRVPDLDDATLNARSKVRARLGVLPHDYARHRADVAHQRFDEAVNVLKKLGHEVADAKIADAPYALAAGTIVDVEGSAAFENLIRSEKLDLLVDPAQRAGLIAGLAIPGTDYLRAMRIRTLAAPKAIELFDRFDALIAPTLLHVAPPIEQPLSQSFPHMGGNGAVGNLLGWPSVTVPMGLGEEELPLGLEIIGAPYDELTILSIAMAFQRETDHHRRRSPRP